MFWYYSNGNAPSPAEIAALAQVVASKVTLAKIGTAGAAAFGPVGWPALGVAGMGYVAYRLFKLSCKAADEAGEPRS